MTIMPGKKNLSEIVKRKISKNEAAIIYFKLSLIDKSFQVYDSQYEAHHEYSLARVKAATR